MPPDGSAFYSESFRLSPTSTAHFFVSPRREKSRGLIEVFMKLSTLAVHAGQQPDPSTGALNTPVYFTSTYSYGTAEEGKARFAGQNPGYIYSRFANPTSTALEQKLAALEGADEAIVVASGMAAVSAIMYALTNA